MPDFAIDVPSTRLSVGDRLRYHARRVQRHPFYVAVKRPFRIAIKSVPRAWRLATQRYRRLPTAIIVGAQKAGTTQLYACVIQHPQCLAAEKKEVSYFSKKAHHSVGWYRSHFPLNYSSQCGPTHCLEASPSYLPTPDGLRQMQALLPDVRIIAVLRDPVARAFSHYEHQKTRHRESRSFAQAIEDALERCQYPARFGAALRPDAEPMLDYVARGYYALQLELLLQLYPRQQVLVLDSADLFDDTGAACQSVFKFLDIPPHAVRWGKIYNRGRYRETIDPVTAQRLRQHYRPYDDLLVQLLGRPFRWMLSSGGQFGAACAGAKERRPAA